MVILPVYSSKLLAKIEHIHQQQNLPYFWSFLDSAITVNHRGSLLQTEDCIVDVVKCLYGLVTRWMAGSAECAEEEEGCGHVLSILGRLDLSLAEVMLQHST